MNTRDAVIVIVGSALITFFYRAVPFLFFKDRPVPQRLEKMKQVLPAALMAVLVVYCLKGAVSADMHGLMALAAGCVSTVVVHRIFGKSIVSIVCGTAVYMMFLHLL
ncbi:MAG: branched-chain amino acid transporter permease [Bulleidia sp.]